MHELVKQFEALLKQAEAAMAKLGLSKQKQRLAELSTQMAGPDFWDDSEAAAKLSKEQAQLSKQIETWDSLEANIKEALELAKLNDHKLEKELQARLEQLTKEYETHEFELTLSGPYDQNDALLHIHAGTGGTDAMDWAQRLERMYLRWAENNDYKTEVISESAGEEAGLKSAILAIEGPYGYGKLRSEHGVHRLVRKSPFNADNLRQTSFALVEVLPQIEQSPELEIDPKDLKVETFRAGGAGGQHVNKAESAVRITHIPTGVTVSIQNERSQLQNRATAMKVLMARLAKLAHEQQAEELAKIKGANLKAEWGQQIRNYVLDPYKLVKDTRSGFETSDVEKTLDGNIDPFIDAYLQKQIGQS